MRQKAGRKAQSAHLKNKSKENSMGLVCPKTKKKADKIQKPNKKFLF